MKRLDDVLNYGLKIYQDSDFFSFSIDSVVLGNYCNLKISDKKIIDLCTGNGIVPIILSKRYDKKIDCIEIQDKLVELAKDETRVIQNKDLLNCISEKDLLDTETLINNLKTENSSCIYQYTGAVTDEVGVTKYYW